MKKLLVVLCLCGVSVAAAALPPVPKGGGKGFIKALEHASPVIKAAPKVKMTPASLRRAYKNVIVDKGGPSQVLQKTMEYYHNLPTPLSTTRTEAKEFNFHEHGADFSNLVRNLSTLGYFYPEQSVRLASLVATKFNDTSAQAVTDIIFARIVMKADTPEAWRLLSKYTNEQEVKGAFWEYVKDVAWEEHRISIRVIKDNQPGSINEVGYPEDRGQLYDAVSNRGVLAVSVFDPTAETTMAYLDTSIVEEELGQLEKTGSGLFLGNAYVPMLTKTKLDEVAVSKEAFENRYLKPSYKSDGDEIYTYYLHLMDAMRDLFSNAEEELRTGALDERDIATYNVKAVSYSYALLSFERTFLRETPETLKNFKDVLQDLITQLELERVIAQ